MYVYIYIYIYRSEGFPERDMISLRMMGWGLAAGKKSSAADAAAAVTAVTHPLGTCFWKI